MCLYLYVSLHGWLFTGMPQRCGYINGMLLQQQNHAMQQLQQVFPLYCKKTTATTAKQRQKQKHFDKKHGNLKK